jgi:ABC-2 type transport system ATP-binding protein
MVKNVSTVSTTQRVITSLEVEKMSLLNIERIVKEYKAGVRANDGISLSVETGEVYGLLGPNGAGKTTLVNQIVGLVKPSSGSIALDGMDITKNPEYAREVCSFQPQTQVPIDGLTTEQAINLVGRMRGGDALTVKSRTAMLIDYLEIQDWAQVRGEKLSGGVRRLVAFCMAAVVPGKLRILDEPTNDVDPLRRRLLWERVRTMADQGSAVLLVTHNVLEAERSVDRLAIIDQGRLISQGTPASMKDASAGFLRMELTLEPNVRLRTIPGFLLEPVNGGRRLIGSVKEGDVGMVVEWASGLRQSSIVEEFSIGPTTLEDAYLRKVGRAENGN